MTEKEAYVAFNMIPDIGWVRLSALAAKFRGSAAEAYAALPAERKRTASGAEPDWRAEIDRARRNKVTLVTPADPEYPASLCDLASRPLCLYVAGSPAALSRQGVAIVGTRRASAYGRDVAERFAYALASAGYAVFSGLAAGIDAAAHRGALAAGGCTAGILGGALDRFFPSANRALAREIAESGGAVVSEYPFGREPDVSTFPQRNRIVAALSKGVVAAECPSKSGTKITVSFAADLGRAVMAVPGGIDRPMSAGCHELIREGACLVRSPDDVIEELSGFSARPAAPRSRPRAAGTRGVRPAAAPSAPFRAPSPEPAPPPEAAVSLEEASVLRGIGDRPSSVDAVVRASGLPAARVNSVLVALRIKRKIRFLPGNRVERVHA